MSTKIKLKEVQVGKSFPATWEGVFTQQPTTSEIDTKKEKVRDRMNEDKANQENAGTCSRGFILDLNWKKVSNDPLKLALNIKTRRDRRFRNGGGDVTPPKPKSPPPPPQ